VRCVWLDIWAMGMCTVRTDTHDYAMADALQYRISYAMAHEVTGQSIQYAIRYGESLFSAPSTNTERIIIQRVRLP
jgi:hypothetical protein